LNEATLFRTAVIVLLMTVRLVQEEDSLVRRFGENYRLYRSTTGKFIPRFGPKPR